MHALTSRGKKKKKNAVRIILCSAEIKVYGFCCCIPFGCVCQLNATVLPATSKKPKEPQNPTIHTQGIDIQSTSLQNYNFCT